MTVNIQTDSGERELRITRTFNAPRALVFEAWSKAEHLKRWFAPNGFTVPACELDFRVGGAYRPCMRGFGNDHWVHGRLSRNSRARTDCMDRHYGRRWQRSVDDDYVRRR